MTKLEMFLVFIWCAYGLIHSVRMFFNSELIIDQSAVFVFVIIGIPLGLILGPLPQIEDKIQGRRNK